MKTIRGGFTAVLMFLWVLTPGCGQEHSPPPSESVRPVVVHKIEDSVTKTTRTFSGAARAEVETFLSFRVSGEIVELLARVGLSVARNDVLARLDPTDFRLQVKEAEAAMAQAKARLSQAKADYERARMLYETDNISRAELDNARAAYNSFRAQVSAAGERVALAEQHLAYTTLSSPIDGLVADVPVENHQSVQAGMPVALLTTPGALRFEMGVPDYLVRDLQMGAPAKVSFESLPHVSLAARVIEVGVLSAQLSIFPVTLELEEKDPRIFPGMIGEASLAFSLGPEQERLPLLPPQGIVNDPLNGHFVWVVDTESMTVSPRPVNIGDLQQNGVMIREGLQAGDRVVIRGVHRLKEGQKVFIFEEKIR